MEQALQARSLRDIYAPLLGPDDGRPDEVHDEAARLSLSDMRRALTLRYMSAPSVHRIELRVSGVVVGVTTRARVCRAAGTAGDTPAGEGDRSSQPGDSTRYRVIHFACETCAEATVMSFYDERLLPTCEAGHGRMELRR